MRTRTPAHCPAAVATIFVLLLGVPTVWATSVTEQTVSPLATRFPQNKQNESPMAVNPVDPMNAITGANDEIEEPDCTPPSVGSSSCPFAPNTNVTGVYITKNGGATWSQQILHWNAFGVVSDGDPAVAFGPKLDGSGRFSYTNGARAYFASLAGSPAFGPNQELLAVAHSDDGGTTWSPPVIATTRDNPVSFNDKVAIAVDANPSSPFFGTVYVSFTLFTGAGNFGESGTFSPEPIMISRSTDGGRTFGLPRKLTSSHNNASVGGRQGSTIRTSPDGTVYVFWDDTLDKRSAILAARSIDGGVTFSRPFLVSFKSDVPPVFPGASFRVNSFPMADIDATGRIFVVWADYTNGHSVVKRATSRDGGTTWTTATATDVPGRSAFYPAVATNGDNVFIGFTAIDDKPAGTAPGASQVHYDAYYTLSTNGGAGFGSPVKISIASSDPDASTTNSLRAQFLGDYHGAAAGPDGAFWFTWTDTRNGSPCAAVDAWRASGFTTPKPNIYDSCPANFGNSDIFVGKVSP